MRSCLDQFQRLWLGPWVCPLHLVTDHANFTIDLIYFLSCFDCWLHPCEWLDLCPLTGHDDRSQLTMTPLSFLTMIMLCVGVSHDLPQFPSHLHPLAARWWWWAVQSCARNPGHVSASHWERLQILLYLYLVVDKGHDIAAICALLWHFRSKNHKHELQRDPIDEVPTVNLFIEWLHPRVTPSLEWPRS